MDDLEIIDVSDSNVNQEDNKEIILGNKNELPPKDRFMTGIYISLIVLIFITLIIYFFGYDLFKPIIKV